MTQTDLAQLLLAIAAVALVTINVLAFWTTCAYAVASRRDRSARWSLMGTFLGLIGVIIVWLFVREDKGWRSHTT